MITRLDYGATTPVDAQRHLIFDPYSIDLKAAGFSDLQVCRGFTTRYEREASPVCAASSHVF